MTTEKLALADLRGSSQFFLKFLGTIGVLMTAHYPILPEAMVTVYRGDSVGARMLTTALTIIGFAAIVAVVSIPRTTFCRFKHQKISTKAALLWCSTVLLMICAFGLAASFTLANISARIANAVSAAELRAPFDR